MPAGCTAKSAIDERVCEAQRLLDAPAWPGLRPPPSARWSKASAQWSSAAATVATGSAWRASCPPARCAGAGVGSGCRGGGRSNSGPGREPI